MVVNRNINFIPRKSYPMLSPREIYGLLRKNGLDDEQARAIGQSLNTIFNKFAVDERLNYDLIEAKLAQIGVETTTPSPTSGVQINAPLIVNGGSGGIIKTTPNGVNWESQGNPTNSVDWTSSFAYSDTLGLFVGATGTSKTDTKLWYSPDGKVWSPGTLPAHTPTTTVIQFISWDPINQLFIITCRDASSADYYTSVDGKTMVFLGNVLGAGGVAKFIDSQQAIIRAHQVNGTPDNVFVDKSVDGGANWTSMGTCTAAKLTPVTITGYGSIIAIGGSISISGGNTLISTTNNGTSWATRTANGALTVAALTVNPTTGLLVACINTSKPYRSTDGITWTVATTASTSNNGNMLTWWKDRYVKTGNNTSVWEWSFDAITWVASANGSSPINNNMSDGR